MSEALCLPVAGGTYGTSRGGLGRVFTSFPAVASGMVIHHDVHIERPSFKGDWTEVGLPPDSLECGTHSLPRVLVWGRQKLGFTSQL